MKNYSKVIILIMISLMTINQAKTQDIILTKDAKSIKAKVLEINEFDIKYKDFDNLEGPAYTLKKSDIQTIVYQNGKVETFTPIEPEKVQTTPPLKTYNELMIMSDNEKEDYLLNMGIQDVYEKFHHGQNLGRTGSGLFKAGLGLSIAGAAVTITGGVLMAVDLWEIGIWFMIPGGTLLGVGQVLTITSIPLRAVGGRVKKTAENMYQNYYSEKMKTSYLPTLDFGLTQNGVGLTLKF